MCSHEGEVVILTGFKSGSEYVWRAPLSAQTGPKGAVGMGRPVCQNRLCGRDCPDGVWALETEVSARDEFHRPSERWVSPGRGLARVFREMGAAVLCGASRGGAVGGGLRLFPTDLAVDEALHDAHILPSLVESDEKSTAVFGVALRQLGALGLKPQGADGYSRHIGRPNQSSCGDIRDNNSGTGFEGPIQRLNDPRNNRSRCQLSRPLDRWAPCECAMTLPTACVEFRRRRRR